jgi:hypothetical protein
VDLPVSGFVLVVKEGSKPLSRELNGGESHALGHE